MSGCLLKRILTAAGAVGLLAGTAVAAPQSNMNNGKTAVATNLAVGPPMTTPAPASQPVAPIGGAFTPALMGGPGRPGYFSTTNWTALGGQISPLPLGGTLQPGSVGGMMNGQHPPGGQMSGVIIGGPPGPSPGGTLLNGHPLGGQLGTNVLGGIRTPTNSFTASPKGVIIGGAQTSGVSPGGVLVGGSSPGGVIVSGAPPPGGVMVGGAPNTTPPGGTLTNAPGGQLH